MREHPYEQLVGEKRASQEAASTGKLAGRKTCNDGLRLFRHWAELGFGGTMFRGGWMKKGKHADSLNVEKGARRRKQPSLSMLTLCPGGEVVTCKLQRGRFHSVSGVPVSWGPSAVEWCSNGGMLVGLAMLPPTQHTAPWQTQEHGWQLPGSVKGWKEQWDKLPMPSAMQFWRRLSQQRAEQEDNNREPFNPENKEENLIAGAKATGVRLMEQLL